MVTSDPSLLRLGTSTRPCSTSHALAHLLARTRETGCHLEVTDPENGAGLRNREVLHVAQKEDLAMLWAQFESSEYDPLKGSRLEYCQ